mgnify:CR=1 FL=1
MAMEHRIEKMDSFRIVGVKMVTTNKEGKGMQDIPAFWGELIQHNKQLEIVPLMNKAPFGLMGVNVYNTYDDDAYKFDYYIACSTDQPVPEGMAEYTVPALTWAIFPGKSDEVQKVMVGIVTEWLPTSGHELVNTGYETGSMEGGAPDIEVYGEGDDVEIWVAIK